MTRARILVMDDDPLFRSLLAATLRKDYLVSVAADGTEGYAKAVEHVPDLAVIDLQMPVCDGLSVLKAFRAHAALRHIPIIILTGDNSKESVVAAIQLGINDYVIKTTFSKPEFVAKVSRLLAGKIRESAVIATEPARALEPARSAVTAPPPAARAVTPPAPKLNIPAAPSVPAPVAVAVAAPSEQNLQSILDNWE